LQDDFNLDMDFSLTKKKKKKKKDIEEDLEGGKQDKADDNENGICRHIYLFILGMYT